MKTKILRHVLVVVALVALAGCNRYPSGRTDISDERPSIAFSGAPEGSVVFVDGQAMGPAAQYDGRENVLLVEPGTHLIRVRLGDRVLLTQRVFFSGQATRTLVVQ